MSTARALAPGECPVAEQGDDGIGWCDTTWNPIRGCSRVSPGCENCYAERMASRFIEPGMAYEGLARRGPNGGRWTGEVRLVPEHLEDPLRWTRPRRIFVNSMSDLFHEKLDDDVRDRIFAVMALSPQHIFQILTKRPQVMRRYMTEDGIGRVGYVEGRAKAMARDRGTPIPDGKTLLWPLPNVWLGVTAEDQQRANERIPPLLNTPAAKRFVSYEPALEHVDFHKWLAPWFCAEHGEVFEHEAKPATDADDAPIMMHAPEHGEWCGFELEAAEEPRLDWIIAGSESGPHARPAELVWYESVRGQCAMAKVAYFGKQHADAKGRKLKLLHEDGLEHKEFPQ